MSRNVGRVLSISSYSLKLKIPLLASLILILVFGIASGFLISDDIKTEKQSLLSRARTFSKLATKPIGDAYNDYYHSGYLKFREALQDIAASNEDIVRIQIIAVDGKILFDTVNIDSSVRDGKREITDKQLLNAITLNKQVELKWLSKDIDQIITPYADDFGARPFSVRYFLSYESVYESINNTILAILLLATAALLLTLISMVYLVHRLILSPLGTIVVSAHEISRGDLQRIIKLSNKDELGDLAVSLNQMTERLKKNIEDLKQLDKLKDEFIFLASHNLRTPLTIIKGYTERLLESSLLGVEEKESLSKVSQSTKDLEATTESLLNLVSLEKRNKPLVKEAADLPEILKRAVDRIASVVGAKKINFIMELPSEEFPKIEADIQRLPQAFSSLLDNAVKFNKIGGKVTVRLEQKENKAVVSISDTGIGIAESEKDLIFKKFHRATDTLTYDYEGIGLGLYLTRLIIESHQGRIWFESKKGIGTTFYVEIPIMEEQKADLSDQH